MSTYWSDLTFVTNLAGIGGVAEVNLNAVARVGGDGSSPAGREMREERVGIAIDGTAEVTGVAEGTGIAVGDMVTGCIRGMDARVSAAGTTPRPASRASSGYDKAWSAHTIACMLACDCMAVGGGSPWPAVMSFFLLNITAQVLRPASRDSTL